MWPNIQNAFHELRDQDTPHFGNGLDAVDYEFWIRWYQGYLDGNPLSDQVLWDIALSDKDIPPSTGARAQKVQIDWKAADPKDTQRQINRIWNDYRLKLSSNFEELQRRDDGLIYAVPTPYVPDEKKNLALSRAQDAAERLLRARNEVPSVAELSSDLERIVKRIKESPNTPILIYEALKDAISNAASIQSLDTGNPVIRNALRDFARSALDLRSFDPGIQEILQARHKNNAEDFTQDLIDLDAETAKEQGDDLRRKNADDVAVLSDKNAPSEKRARAAVRWSERMIRQLLLILDEINKNLKTADSLSNIWQMIRKILTWFG